MYTQLQWGNHGTAGGSQKRVLRKREEEGNEKEALIYCKTASQQNLKLIYIPFIYNSHTCPHPNNLFPHYNTVICSA